MFRVTIGVQQAHAHRARSGGAQHLGQRRHSSLVQGTVDGSVGQDPFGYGEGEPTGHERFGFFETRVVHIVAVLAAD